MVAGALDPAAFTIVPEPVPFVLPAGTRFEGATVEMIRYGVLSRWVPRTTCSRPRRGPRTGRPRRRGDRPRPDDADVPVRAVGAAIPARGDAASHGARRADVLPRLPGEFDRRRRRPRDRGRADDRADATPATENDMLIGVVFPDRIPLPPRLSIRSCWAR